MVGCYRKLVHSETSESFESLGSQDGVQSLKVEPYRKAGKAEEKLKKVSIQQKG